ncbi:SDR family oxidoreductase [Chlamydiota bacterium]
MVHPLIVIGSRGFIGSHFCRAFPEALAIDRSQLDLCNPQITFSTEGRVYAVIAAGVGNPRKCEADPETSYRCNVTGTLALGKELLKRGILPIFFSTDYVLDETLNVAPLNTYGRQKAELEREGASLSALVVRLTKVYGIEKGDGTLFDEMAALLMAGKEVRAARDQLFAPLFVGDVVRQVVEWERRGVKGVVTAAGPTYASRLEMARYMAQKLGADEKLVREISLDDLNDGLRRPKRLALKGDFRGDFPSLPWQEGIERVVQAYA